MNELFDTAWFSKQGKRDYNEDSVFPNIDIPSDLKNLFLVCDGVGGQEHGEIASDLCCTQLNQFFTQNKIENSDQNTIDQAVKFVEKKFDDYKTQHAEVGDMASTITLLHLHSKGATVAHMGDSRVYLFRDGEILFKTKDHSVVQDLFDAGVIETEAEMATHQHRNRINRAMRGTSEKSYKADTSILTDLQENDIFLLCTDGVLESFSNAQLAEVFKNYIDVNSSKEVIMNECAKNSSDNYSAFIVKLNAEYIQQLN